MKRLLALLLPATLCLSVLAGSFLAAAAPSTYVWETAYMNSQTIYVNGEAMTFYVAALKDDYGTTNYVKLRDVAHALRATPKHFGVGYQNGKVTITAGGNYTPNGTEMRQIFTGTEKARWVLYDDSDLIINGEADTMQRLYLTDSAGGGHTYFNLRHLGVEFDFYVGWDASRSAVTIDTSRPYEYSDQGEDSDDDQTESDIEYGTYHSVETMSGSVFPVAYQPTLRLNADGTFKFVANAAEGMVTARGTFAVSGSTLTLTVSGWDGYGFTGDDAKSIIFTIRDNGILRFDSPDTIGLTGSGDVFILD